MKTLRLLAVLAMGMAAFGCSDDDSPTSPLPPTVEPPAAINDVRLRVAHLSPDAPAVDILVNGDVVLSGVQYKDISEYLDLASGEYRIQVTPAGNNSVSVIDATVMLESGYVYTVAATGFVADIQPWVLTDGLATTSGARVRPAHASPDAPAVDLALKDGPVLVSGLSFRETGPYLDVDPGVYDLEVRLAGTNTVVLSIDDVDLAAGTTSTAFVVGSAAAGTLEPVAAQDAP